MRTHITSRLAVALAIATAAMAPAACSDQAATDDGKPAANTNPPKSSSYGFGDAKLDPYRKSARAEPKARIPSRPPPRGLTMEDLRYGSGPMIGPGDEAIVNYVGYHYATKRRFDSSYGLNPAPYKVYPGNDDYIDGFEDGIVGMRVGGRRQITIPPDKGYGNNGYHDIVKPGETLVFVINLEALDKRR